MSDPSMVFGVAVVLVNAAVTWATVRTQVVFLRRDVDELRAHVFGVRS